MVIDNTPGNMSAPNPGLWHQISRSDVPSDGNGNTVNLFPEGGAGNGDMEYKWGDNDVDGHWTNLNPDQWNLIEYRMNKPNGTIEVRVDEEDVTADFHRYRWGQQDISLADDNGDFVFTAHNYFKLCTYDKEQCSVGDMIEDYAG